MFCRNCGNEIADNAAVCVNCGVAVGKALNYCPNCGYETHSDAVVCVKCGIALKKNNNFSTQSSGEKTKLIAGLLAIFLGIFGVHKFYLGYQRVGIIRLIISIVFMILAFLIGGFLFTNIFGYIGKFGLFVMFVISIIDAVNIFTNRVTTVDGMILN
ncbi:MAG: TM2 domain-containing protein [Clostridia bacterium]|nr:TM2 domain-containing protein [Clostridia bacterium]